MRFAISDEDEYGAYIFGKDSKIFRIAELD